MIEGVIGLIAAELERQREAREASAAREGEWTDRWADREAASGLTETEDDDGEDDDMEISYVGGGA